MPNTFHIPTTCITYMYWKMGKCFSSVGCVGVAHYLLPGDHNAGCYSFHYYTNWNRYVSITALKESMFYCKVIWFGGMEDGSVFVSSQNNPVWEDIFFVGNCHRKRDYSCVIKFSRPTNLIVRFLLKQHQCLWFKISE